MIQLVIATRNLHKVGEIRAVLGQSFGYCTLRDLPAAPEVIEDAPTFAGNATKKALQLAHWLAGNPTLWPDAMALASGKASHGPDVYTLADDSGLEVDALHGAPGVHSARFAALGTALPGNSPDAANNNKLLGLLEAVPPEKRTARFRCVIALTPVLRPQAETSSPACAADEAELRTEIFTGACEGRILIAPRGQHGFGYDPLFVPEGFTETFAELGEATKNQISHRAKALRQLQPWLEKQRGS